MKRLRSVFSLMVLSVLVFFSPLAADAQTLSNIGASMSFDINSLIFSGGFSFDAMNDFILSHFTDTETLTGENDLTGNIGDADIVTGNADAEGEFIIRGNVLSTDFVEDTSGFVYEGVNQNITYGSYALNDFGIASVFDLMLENIADVFNNIIFEQVTGRNTANGNTGHAIVDTGDAESAVILGNLLNSTESSKAADKNEQTKVDFVNKNISSSEAHNFLVATLESDIIVGNVADLENSVYIENETGENQVFGNLGSADPSVHTGDIDAVFVNANTVNSGFGVEANIENLDIDARNENMTMSDVSNVVYESADFYVDLYNDAYIENDFVTLNDSGNNEVVGNIGDSEVVTGDIESKKIISDSINSGSSMGAKVDDINVDLVNKNASDSTAINDVDIHVSMDASAVNEADMDENVIEVNNTGLNVVSGNIGGGAISTGGVSSQARLIIEANGI